jgi:two-component system, response regulator / RNA-binding antiterminator
MQGPIQNFRGRAALLITQEDRNADVLKTTLGKLGVSVALCDPRAGGERTSELAALADIVIVDTDAVEPADAVLFAGSRLPVIALIGLESPTRLQRAHDIQPTAVIMKPVRSNGVFTALYFAFNERRRQQQLKDTLASATERIAARRIVVKAIIHLMQCSGFDDEEAYRMQCSGFDDEEAYRYLRKESMSRRISVEELSAQILTVRREDLEGRKTRA